MDMEFISYKDLMEMTNNWLNVRIGITVNQSTRQIHKEDRKYTST